jgi:hypothetical protein
LPDYSAQLDAYAAEHEGQIYDRELTDPSGRYLLVEVSRFDGTLLLSSHNSPEVAAAYHDGQDEPADWPVLELIDLEAGEAVPHVTEVTHQTTFTPIGTPPAETRSERGQE